MQEVIRSGRAMEWSSEQLRGQMVSFLVYHLANGPPHIRPNIMMAIGMPMHKVVARFCNGSKMGWYDTVGVG
jgi:hypothetical protein